MDASDVTVSAESPYCGDAVMLMQELSRQLRAMTGDSGNASFDAGDVCDERAVFAIARDQDGNGVGCGAIRPISKTTAEVKRMYTREKGRGIGRLLLAFLEECAYNMGYHSLCLETRLVNQGAVAFYEKNGYGRIPNYGKYINRPECVCFEKRLIPGGD